MPALEPLRIIAPPAAATLAGGHEIMLRAVGGERPLHFLVHGAPIAATPALRGTEWMPPGAGFFHVSVLGAAGHSANLSLPIVVSETRNEQCRVYPTGCAVLMARPLGRLLHEASEVIAQRRPAPLRKPEEADKSRGPPPKRCAWKPSQSGITHVSTSGRTSWCAARPGPPEGRLGAATDSEAGTEDPCGTEESSSMTRPARRRPDLAQEPDALVGPARMCASRVLQSTSVARSYESSHGPAPAAVRTRQGWCVQDVAGLLQIAEKLAQ